MARKEAEMARLTAKDIMHPRVSVTSKEKGRDLLTKMMSGYPALPVVNDNLEVIGTVSEYNILDAVREGKTINEFSAETIMSCGHGEHFESSCKAPVTVRTDTPIKEIIDKMYSEHLSILPVVEGKKLVGMISRKNIINAMSEKGLWPEEEFRKRT
ncbi:MAG: CBS domain-containing protein [Nitrospirota bacterium]|nr:CBS domain-containing protein [Nitrospirota bacterium]